MTKTIPPFSELSFPWPDEQSLKARYDAIASLLDAGDRVEALHAFDAARREYESWASHVHLQFSRNTQDEAAKADRDYADRLSPVATDHEVTVKKRILADPDREGLEAIVTPHVVRLWEADTTTFDPRISTDLEEEARLAGEYTALLAGAKIPFDGKMLNLSGLVPYLQGMDRDVRHAAEAARWAFFEENGAELDALYGKLVVLRDRMAKTLGFENYIELGYRRMRRTDYGPEQVAAFREKVLAYVTPLISSLIERRRLKMGWDKVMAWDEALIDLQGNPGPAGDHDLLVARAEGMFRDLDPSGEMADFYAQMRDLGYLDLKNREGKAGGGFCTSFPTVGTPYIFANFNGTHNDIGVFTHEMGHAFQNWKSRDLPWIDQLWPTMEAAEIHSMGLEFLTWPQIGALVEDGAADRYRRMHLIDALSFFPYGVCVDHFQHEVYARPEMTPEERHQTWRRLEKLYMPWRDWGDLAYPAKGGRWQAQLHIYRLPFYYIDYALAQCCALQLWLGSRLDREGTLEIYRRLCAEGGLKPFAQLVSEAGLISPFEADVLAEVVHEAEQVFAL
ncbi:M3 family oligoendopeptidase [Gluconobacter sphaericus]|nr:M3 family oligoendopeptidase [Gluconobacter sphaericus]MBF0886287.1 M3 family oligoendopeptidase [Gluconobacter sphaericus]MBS1086369.1 M3 family oligoendopeptidase [Gluconobacter sphaericus]MBS1100367.1 M3 family oligoendopeptidase [Gluconobacter sphaericus]